MKMKLIAVITTLVLSAVGAAGFSSDESSVFTIFLASVSDQIMSIDDSEYTPYMYEEAIKLTTESLSRTIEKTMNDLR